MPRLGAVDVDACVDCPSGYMCDSDGMEFPNICPTGHYCAEGTDGEDGVSGSQQSVPCTLGEFCPITDTRLDDDKVDGSTGTHYTNTQGFGNALSCPYGSYQDATSLSADPTECQTCEDGFKCPNLGMDANEACDTGYYCDSGAVTHYDCPEGEYTVANTES